MKPASAWLASVATKIPAMIGTGRRKRAARTSASSWVLSPISPSATTAVETSKASMGRAGRVRCGEGDGCRPSAGRGVVRVRLPVRRRLDAGPGRIIPAAHRRAGNQSGFAGTNFARLGARRALLRRPRPLPMNPDRLARLRRHARATLVRGAGLGRGGGGRGVRARRRGQDAARRSRAGRREDGARPGRAADRRAAAEDGEGLAHVLAESRRLGPAHDPRMEAAGRRRGGAHRMAGAGPPAGRAAREFRLRGRGAAVERSSSPRRHSRPAAPRSSPRAPTGSSARRSASRRGSTSAWSCRCAAAPRRTRAGVPRSTPRARRCRGRSPAGR